MSLLNVMQFEAGGGVEGLETELCGFGADVGIGVGVVI